MNKITINHDGYTFMRINKTKAKRVYQSGRSIMVVACKLDPFNPWWFPGFITEPNRCDEETFDHFVNSFEYYNCGLPECGKYAAYYIPVMETENGYIYNESFEGVQE